MRICLMSYMPVIDHIQLVEKVAGHSEVLQMSNFSKESYTVDGYH